MSQQNVIISHYDKKNSMETLPTTTPAEALEISPESLEIANCYLQEQSIQKVADSLSVPLDLVTQTLDRREVKAYVNQVFGSLGFNNRFKLAEAMDAIIAKKFQEMDEADIGSTKDITEILALKHKMMTDHMAHELAMAKVNASSVRTQTNIQINDNAIGGTKYSALIEKLLSNGDVIDA
jgi:hypothetical protein